MEPTGLENLLKAKLPGADVTVSGNGCDLTVTVISDAFESLSTLKRQQEVYRHLSDLIASGELHAVSLQTLTRTEQAARDSTG